MALPLDDVVQVAVVDPFAGEAHHVDAGQPVPGAAPVRRAQGFPVGEHAILVDAAVASPSSGAKTTNNLMLRL